MKQIISLALAGGVLLTPLVAEANPLTVVNQGGAPGEAQTATVFVPFTEETGIEIIVDTYNQELAKIRSQVETGNLIWDVVSVHSLNEAIACEEGLLEPIDWAAELNEADFASVGGFGKCGAPYFVSPGAMVYDADRYPDDPPQTWADFWNVEKWPGKRAFPNQPDQVLEAALMADGVAPKDVAAVLAAADGADRAFAKLEELKPHILWWKSGDESMQLLLKGEVVMAYGWQGRVNAANKSNDRNLKISWGAGYVSAVIYFGVMAGSENMKEAVELIKYTLSSGPQAAFAELMWYPPANAQAYPLLSQENRNNQPTEFQDRGMIQTGDTYLTYWLDNGDELRQRFATFTAR